MDDIIKTVLSTIDNYQMLLNGDHVVVGVSGGPDSMCLLHILCQMRERREIRLTAVHLNHCFRGAEADADMEYVQNICGAWKVPCIAEKRDIPFFAATRGLTAEEAGRVARYDLFERVCAERGGTKIAVAQNMNDNAETVLLHLMRGAGMDGIRGIEPVRNNRIRPLLYVKREQIEAYCNSHGIKPRVDQTNAEPIYTRNRIRLELIPYMERSFNPNLQETLSRFSVLIGEENDFLEKETKKLFNSIAKVGMNRVECYISDIENLHIAMQKRVLRMAIQQVAGNLDRIEQKHINLALHLLSEATGATLQLPGELIILKSYGKIIIQRMQAESLRQFCYALDQIGAYYFEELGIHVQITWYQKKNAYRLNKKTNMIAIDKAAIQNGLVLRNRRIGDRISPIGMCGSKKISAFMVDEKIPKAERDKLLFIADGAEVVWIVGRRFSEKYKVTDDTKEIIEIEINRVEIIEGENNAQ